MLFYQAAKTTHDVVIIGSGMSVPCMASTRIERIHRENAIQPHPIVTVAQPASGWRCSGDTFPSWGVYSTKTLPERINPTLFLFWRSISTLYLRYACFCGVSPRTKTLIDRDPCAEFPEGHIGWSCVIMWQARSVIILYDPIGSAPPPLTPPRNWVN